MTIEEFWKSWLSFWFLAGPILLAPVVFVYSLYLSRFQIGAIKEALKNSRYIYIWGDSLGKRGLILSLLEIAKITGMIMMPKSYIRLGDLNPIDFEKFPHHLKRLLRIEFFMICIGNIWLVIAAALVKLR